MYTKSSLVLLLPECTEAPRDSQETQCYSWAQACNSMLQLGSGFADVCDDSLMLSYAAGNLIGPGGSAEVSIEGQSKQITNHYILSSIKSSRGVESHMT